MLIDEAPNMRGQMLWYHSDSSLNNIYEGLSRLVLKVNVKATDPCLPDHYTVM